MPRAVDAAMSPPRRAKIEGFGALGFCLGVPGLGGALPDMLGV